MGDDGAPHIFFVDRQVTSAPIPEVAEAVTLKNPAAVRRLSFRTSPAVGAPPPACAVEFVVDALCDVQVTVHYGATVTVTPAGVGVASAATLPPILLPPGSSVVTPPSPLPAAIAAAALAGAGGTTAPMVVALRYAMPPEDGAPPGPAAHISVCELVAAAAGAPPGVRAVRQILQVGPAVFDLEDVFGADPGVASPPRPPSAGCVAGVPCAAAAGGPAAAGGAAAGEVEVEDETCVVCLTNDRDTMILPCRHMCLCAECADVLRRQTNKCPICRTAIDRLLTRKAATS